MSLDIKTKEVFYIDDTRQLNYLECMGLIQNSLMFNLIEPIKGDGWAEINIFKNLMANYFNSYVMSCDPEIKAVILDFKQQSHFSHEYNCTVRFVPANENLIIDYINEEGVRFAKSIYSVEKLLDLLL